MGLLWPRHINPRPNTFTRIGRLAHWAAFGVGAFFLIACFSVLLVSTVARDQWAAILVGSGLFVAFALFGRAIRWIVARE